MKSALRKVARLSFALIIPAALLVGCQEDVQDPTVEIPDTNMGVPGKPKGRP